MQRATGNGGPPEGEELHSSDQVKERLNGPQCRRIETAYDSVTVENCSPHQRREVKDPRLSWTARRDKRGHSASASLLPPETAWRLPLPSFPRLRPPKAAAAGHPAEARRFAPRRTHPGQPRRRPGHPVCPRGGGRSTGMTPDPRETETSFARGLCLETLLSAPDRGNRLTPSLRPRLGPSHRSSLTRGVQLSPFRPRQCQGLPQRAAASHRGTRCHESETVHRGERRRSAAPSREA